LLVELGACGIGNSIERGKLANRDDHHEPLDEE
jgi:hypothetical protein